MNPFRALLPFLSVAALAGCSVLEDDAGSEPEPEPTASALTYYRDVLPVVYAKCMPCHTAGGAGGIAFDEVGTAQTWAGTMAYETAGDVMPPWPPDETKTDFVGEEARTLTATEKQVFTDWSNAGAPAGDPADAPAPPVPARTCWACRTSPHRRRNTFSTTPRSRTRSSASTSIPGSSPRPISSPPTSRRGTRRSCIT